MTHNKQVYINDVGPRDGLQNQSKILSVEQRLALINGLTDAGLYGVEVGAFVSPKAVPAMAGTDKIYTTLNRQKNRECHYSVLIPNKRGFDIACEHKAEIASLVMAASNTMNEKNIGMNNATTLAMIHELLSEAKNTDIDLQVYLATAWECPFEGVIEAQKVVELAAQLIDMGASRIVVADTIGAADPQASHSLMATLAEHFGANNFACHFHDTRAMGVANVYAALEAGIRRFDASIAGLGGCPFAPGASGNVATEDLVMMCEQMGYTTGIDMARLLAVSDLASEFTQTTTGGNAKPWLRKQFPLAQVC